MVEMINRTTGGPMWVHESRVREYLAAGHRLAAAPAAEKTGTPPAKTPAAKKKGRKGAG